MRYKPMGRNRTYQVDVPQLSGGINVLDHPTKIADNELTAARNLRWKNGALRKRQAVRAVGTAPFVSVPVEPYPIAGRADNIPPHPIEIYGEPCTIVYSDAMYQNVDSGSGDHARVQVIAFDGRVRATYRAPSSISDAAFVPCDDRYGCPFLMVRGGEVYKPDDATGTMKRFGDDDLYAPLVMINGRSVSGDESAAVQQTANGVMYEGFNLLTGRFRARFTSQGYSASECYKLPARLKKGSEVTVECVLPGGVSVCKATVGETVQDNGKTLTVDEDGTVTVYHAFPKSDIADNVTITATAVQLSTIAILEQPGAVWFGGTQNKLGGTRLFLAGFADQRAVVRWSDVNDPLYFPENNYMAVGDLSQRITALEKQGDKLVIFKEREVYYTTYIQGEIDADSVISGVNVDVTVSQAYFPLTQLSPYIGCDAPHSLATCGDRLVWMCSDGRIYTLALGSPYSELNVREIGQKIAPLTQAHDKTLLRRATAMDHDGCYVVMVGNDAYSVDYRGGGLYASEPSKHLAWYAHRFDGFSPQETPRLVSDGVRALLISTQDVGDSFTHVRTLYRFADEAEDSYCRVTAERAEGRLSLLTVLSYHPVAASVTTKVFDFGDAGRFKRVNTAHVYADGEAVEAVFCADGADAHAVHRVCVSGHGGRVFPGVKRCRTCSLTLATEKPFALLGLQMRYAVLGDV